MDGTTIINLISRWFHIIPAVVLVGGTLFLRLTVLPAFTTHPHPELREAMRRKWAKWIGVSTLLLLLTGFYNAYSKITTYELSGIYNGLLLAKLLLAFAIFYFAAVLSGKSKTAVKFRQRESYWTNVLCGLMLAIILVAGAMKVTSTGALHKRRTVGGSDVTNFIEPMSAN